LKAWFVGVLKKLEIFRDFYPEPIFIPEKIEIFLYFLKVGDFLEKVVV
jgi:hypothetical protein